MEAVLFDLFGTIVPPYRKREHHDALERIAGVLDIDFDDLLRGWTGTWDERATGGFTSITENLRAIVPSAAPDRLDEAHRIYHDFTVETLVPKPGALDVLDWLVGEGVSTGLVTNCAPDVPELWSQTRWAARFDATVFSCRFGARKPTPGIYEAALAELGVAAGSTVFVGDGSDRELEGAAAVGMRPVLVRNEETDAHDPDRPAAEAVAVAVVDHLSELRAVLERL